MAEKFLGGQTYDGVVLVDLTGTPYVASGGGGGGGGPSRIGVVTRWLCATAFSGASVGDQITETQIIDVTTTPVTVTTLWRNQSTSTDLGSAPSVANLEVLGANALTQAQLAATTVNSSITNYGSYPGLTQTQLAGMTVPVTGPLTDAELRATPIEISGTVTTNTTIDNYGSYPGLTDTELRATPVPVSGTVSTNTTITNYGTYPGLTEAQLASTNVNTSVNNTVIVKNLPTSRMQVGQVRLDTTDSQVQFPGGELINGVIVKASPLNSDVLFVGVDGVNTVNDGTGRGFFLSPGEATSLAVDDLKQIFIIGTANDFVGFIGS